MAKMIKCKGCGEQISKNAKICPKCGEPAPKKTSLLTWLVLILFIIFMVNYNNTKTRSSEKPVALTPAEKRVKNIESQFSSWDGSHYALTKYIKQHMKDPDSYEHIETRYSDKGKYLLVITKYRGKNSFGGIIPGVVIAKISINGKILSIENN